MTLLKWFYLILWLAVAAGAHYLLYLLARYWIKLRRKWLFAEDEQDNED